MNNETFNALTPEQIQQDANIFNDTVDFKKPPNAFIIFYKHCKAELMENKDNIPSNEIDRMIGKMWQMAEEETKNNYREQAKQFSEIFKQVHPDYIEPRKRKNIISQEKTPEPIQIRVILNSDSNQETLALNQSIQQIQDIQQIQMQPQQISPIPQEQNEIGQVQAQQNHPFEQ